MFSKPGAATPALFAIAAFAGLGAALLSALGIDDLPGGRGAAYVNGEPIPPSEYARALSAMQAGLQRPLTAEDKTRALRRLIDEELIVQEAARLGLAQSDRLIRKNLVEAVIRAPGTLATLAPLTDEALRTFFNENRALFDVARIVTVEAVRADTERNANAFVDALQSGASFESARERAGLERLPVPADLPILKIGDYLGGGPRDAVMAMKKDDIAGPLETDSGAVFLWMTNSTGEERSFEQAKDDVRREVERRQDEEAFGAYIARLRSNARIKIIADPDESA